MATLHDILSKAGVDLASRIMVIRSNSDKADVTSSEGAILPEAFRKHLSKECRPFIDEYDYVVCFLATEQHDAVFEAIYSITKDGELEKYMDFEQLGGYPVLKWKPDTPAYFQLGKQPLEIESVIPARYYHALDPKSGLWMAKSFSALDEAVRRPYQDWRELLVRSKGIYQISDFLEGKLYVGEATGQNGMWAEFECFVRTNGHGNYPALIELTKGNPDRAYHFSFQIGRLCSNDADWKVARYEMNLLANHGFIKLTHLAISK